MTVTAVRTAPARRFPAWLVILAASLPMFMATLDNLVVTNALPVISRDLGANLEQLQWVVNAYTLSFATFMLMAVAIGDRLGRQRIFLAGLIIFTGASALDALSTQTWMLIASRALQGVGAAAVMPLSLTLIAGTVSTRLRPVAIGVWGGISGLGVALGPLIGGAVVQWWNWQAIFWINVPLGIISIPLIIAVLPNSFGEKVRADIVGLLLAGFSVLGIVFGIVRGNNAGWSSLQVLVSLIGGAVLMILFLFWETRATAPLLPLRLFRDRSFTVANVVGFAFSFGIFGSVFILIQFLQVVQGHTPLEAGVMTMPWTLAPMVVSPLTGIFSSRTGTRLPITLGLVVLAIAIGWIASELSATLGYDQMWPPFLLAGIGMGLIFAPSSTAVLANMTPEQQAKASGTNSTLREIGVALGVAVLTAVFTGAGGQLTPTGYVHAAIPAVYVGAVVIAIAAVISVALPSKKRAAELRDALQRTSGGTDPDGRLADPAASGAALG